MDKYNCGICGVSPYFVDHSLINIPRPQPRRCLSHGVARGHQVRHNVCHWPIITMDWREDASVLIAWRASPLLDAPSFGISTPTQQSIAIIMRRAGSMVKEPPPPRHGTASAPSWASWAIIHGFEPSNICAQDEQTPVARPPQVDSDRRRNLDRRPRSIWV